MAASNAAAARKRQAEAVPGAPTMPRLVSDPERKHARVPAFSINDVEYTISTKPRVNQALRYLHVCRTQGTEAGIDYMLGVLLGDEAYEALMSFDDLTEQELEQVITIASKIMTGAVEPPKGRQPSA